MAARGRDNASRCQKVARSIVESDGSVWLINRVDKLVFVTTFWIVRG
jgi:hypothetical protein